ncbi:hypothetical protein BJ508DRAFT_336395 [Ascobolus immersus RN42]|uniref:Uncharacterized protein n=1 Tax=Ascobolus immersus RN42 TaxID=1160509 RepID=A0A3N4HCT8_ASCIM|nr:hypothetical protein BJ508DRAFT_336395 [Ascobolus immersus RN42]
MTTTSESLESQLSRLHLNPTDTATTTPITDQPDHVITFATYYNANPDEFQLSNSESSEYRLLNWVIESVLQDELSTDPPDTSIFAVRPSLPDFLRQPTAELLLFYFRRPDGLQQYLLNCRKGTNAYIIQEFEGSPDAKMPAFLRMLSKVIFRAYRRHETGLMRKEQIELATIVLKATISELRCLMNRGEGIEEISEACLRSYVLLDDFIINDDFRSHRLELLLLRYVHEGAEVNWDVVDEVNKKTMEKGRQLALTMLKEGNYRFSIEERCGHYTFLYPSTTWSTD